MRIGVDTGGTFTDFVVLRDDGSLDFFKLLSDPADPGAVILRGIARAAGPTGVEEVRHGSTVATNALLERKGARTALVTSPGFRDVLALGRQFRTALYSLHPGERLSLVPAERCFEWSGDAEALRRELHLAGVEAVAICLLNSFKDASEERRLEQDLRDCGYVCRSSAIAPEFREYERASTTVLNAYVGPLMDRYLFRLDSQCGFPLQVMQSNGGLLSAAEARAQAVRTILSGPAGGVIAAQAFARRAGFSQALAFDMGGTSTDVSLVEDPLRFATEASVDELPVRVPLLDIHTVGAGGGSLARVDAAGRLSAGPQSAGAKPGPACYGVGLQATVTDAQVVLGRIVPVHFSEGAIHICRDRAAAALTPLAVALGLSPEQTADAIVQVANSNMERAIRVVSVERGRDARDFPLVAFGGGGGLHACQIAQELGIRTVLFPGFAGALSALGMLLADSVRDYAVGSLGMTDIEARFAALEAAARRDNPAARLDRLADIRYQGQSYELTVVWDGVHPRAPFEAEFKKLYGYVDEEREIEVVTLRVRATVPTGRDWFFTAGCEPPGTAEPALYQVFLEGERRGIPGFLRDSVPPQTVGPALVFDRGSTIFLPSGWLMRRMPGYVLALWQGPAE